MDVSVWCVFFPNLFISLLFPTLMESSISERTLLERQQRWDREKHNTKYEVTDAKWDKIEGKNYGIAFENCAYYLDEAASSHTHTALSQSFVWRAM